VEKEIMVIEYLLEEIKEQVKLVESYEERKKKAYMFCSDHNKDMDCKTMIAFDIYEIPSRATITKNSMKIRQLLLKLYRYGHMNNEK
jgi:hypothetical protein